ncbi:MAG: hypothetical protein AAFY71_16300 [Bacteroidota bacterium]
MSVDPKWSVLQQALYYDQQGDWHQAHDLVDGMEGKKAAHIHAYLHRKEGDAWNARYWYNRADQPVFEGSLEEEWEKLWNRYST